MRPQDNDTGGFFVALLRKSEEAPVDAAPVDATAVDAAAVDAGGGAW